MQARFMLALALLPCLRAYIEVISTDEKYPDRIADFGPSYLQRDRADF